MSLYEIISMLRAMEKRRKKDEAGPPMSDEEFDALIDRVRAMNFSDVRL